MIQRPNAGARQDAASSPSVTNTPIKGGVGVGGRIGSGKSRLGPKGRLGKKSSSPFTSIYAFMILIIIGMFATIIYGVKSLSETTSANSSNSGRNLRRNLVPPEEAKTILQKIKNEFETRYSGFTSTLMERGVKSFGSIDSTAQRMVEASIEGRPFVMAFSGYSVTVGRGNFFNQSFPFQVQRILNEPMKELLQIPSLVVRNGAIGGIPSFPYGFCLEHFLGSDPDVISWDYSMNEGPRDASVLEAFIRQSTKQLPKQPMMIILDQNENRMKLLDDYAQRGWLRDAIAVGKKDILDDDVFQKSPISPGFDHWDEFGAPNGCPGRAGWHPKKQEHAMIGWMIAMHFVSAMERAYELLAEQRKVGGSMEAVSRDLKAPKFSKPLSRVANNAPEMTELLYGHGESDEDSYFMKSLSCRTSFLPATDHSKVIPSIVVSGHAESTLDIMVERTDDHYKEGWVLDVSKVERDTKRKVERCGGLGYIDMKIAMYGIPESGTLRLWLPFEGPSHDHHDHDDSDANAAKHWFDDLIFCEANEKRSDEACKLDRDLDIVVGGVNVASSSISPVNGAAEYLKRKTCVNVGVPDNAQITKLKDVRTKDGQSLSAEERRILGGGSTTDDEAIGLLIDVTPRDKVTRQDGACCLSHIVWEMH